LTARFGAAFATLTTAVLGSGLAVPAYADTGPCQQPAPVCQAYDTAKAELTAALAKAETGCTATFDSTPCPELVTLIALAETWAFFPYDVCAHVSGTEYCIGPIE
jgi:hypothetical protein